MKNVKNRIKGFTLIELLVVIAIIGILSAVILASLDTARAKGANAAIESDLDSMRAQAELDYSNNTPNGYTGTTNVCADTIVAAAMGNAQSNASIPVAAVTANTTGSATTVTCNQGLSSWAIESPLKTPINGNNYWCVDNNGNSKSETTFLTGGAAITCS